MAKCLQLHHLIRHAVSSNFCRNLMPKTTDLPFLTLVMMTNGFALETFSPQSFHKTFLRKEELFFRKSKVIHLGQDNFQKGQISKLILSSSTLSQGAYSVPRTALLCILRSFNSQYLTTTHKVLSLLC